MKKFFVSLLALIALSASAGMVFAYSADDDYYGDYDSDYDDDVDYKELWEKDMEFLRSFESKLNGYTEDIGPLYRKYDSKNAKGYKLIERVKPGQTGENEFGYYWEDSVLSRSWNSVGLMLTPEGLELRYLDYSTDYDEGTDLEYNHIPNKIKVLGYDIYYNESNACKEVVVYTKNAGLIHIWGPEECEDEVEGDLSTTGIHFENGGIEITGGRLW